MSFNCIFFIRRPLKIKINLLYIYRGFSSYLIEHTVCSHKKNHCEERSRKLFPVCFYNVRARGRNFFVKPSGTFTNYGSLQPLIQIQDVTLCNHISVSGRTRTGFFSKTLRPPSCVAVKQDRQCVHNVALRRVYETTVAVESNKYYIFLCVFVCVCVCARARVLGCRHART